MTIAVSAGRVLVILGIVPVSCLRDPESKSPEDTYAGRYAGAKCEVLGSCCAANGLAWDPDNCVLGGAGYVQSGVDAAKAHGAVFDAAAAEECIRLTVEATRQCTSNDAVTEACGRVFTGINPPGSTCTTDLDCEESTEGRGACYWTSATGEPLSGVCVIKTRPATIGAACAGTSGSVPTTIADCDADGLQCTLAGTCQPLGAIGDPCGTFARCDRSATCDPATSQCAARSAAWAPCQTDDECMSDLCIDGTCAENGAGAPTPCNGGSG